MPTTSGTLIFRGGVGDADGDAEDADGDGDVDRVDDVGDAAADVAAAAVDEGDGIGPDEVPSANPTAQPMNVPSPRNTPAMSVTMPPEKPVR